jgi:hypothetical protein
MASVDVCVRDDANRTLILQEIWNRFDDFGRAARSSDRKAAEAAELAIGLGSERPYRVALCWLLVDNAANAPCSPAIRRSSPHGFLDRCGSGSKRSRPAGRYPLGMEWPGWICAQAGSFPSGAAHRDERAVSCSGHA